MTTGSTFNTNPNPTPLTGEPMGYRRGRTDYGRIRDEAADRSVSAVEVTREEFDEMLECVPPIYAPGVQGFLVGECITGDERGAVYANYYGYNGKYWARYHQARDL